MPIISVNPMTLLGLPGAILLDSNLFVSIQQMSKWPWPLSVSRLVWMVQIPTTTDPGYASGDIRLGELLFQCQYIPLYMSWPVHTTIGCGKQGFPSAQPYLSHTPAG